MGKELPAFQLLSSNILLHLYTDTCDVEIKAVLAQADVERKEKVISYISKASLGREKNYHRD